LGNWQQPNRTPVELAMEERLTVLTLLIVRPLPLV